MHKWHTVSDYGYPVTKSPVIGYPQDCRPVANFLYEICLQGIVVVVFLKINTQSKMMNETTVICCMCIL